MKIVKSISLYFKEGSSDKEYHIQLIEENGKHLVNFQFGRVGNTLQTGSKTPAPVELAAAEKIYTKILNEKLAKGYTEGQKKSNFVESAGSAPQRKEIIILPQLLNTVDDEKWLEELIKDDRYLAQEKKDGERRMVISNIKVIGLNKKGTQVSLPDSIIEAIRGIDCTLDGEIIGDSLYAFDLLSKNGEDIRNRSCVERISLLNLFGSMKPNSGIIVVETASTTKEKRALFNRLKAENKEGIVFKLKNSPYTAGRPNSGGSQLKYKFYKTATFIVADVSTGKRSVGLEVVVAGRDVKPGDKFDREFMGKVTIPANHDIPKVGDFVEVRYLYAYVGGAIFQPVYLGKRNDSDLSDALISQIVYKRKEEV